MEIEHGMRAVPGLPRSLRVLVGLDEGMGDGLWA
jgi:hypothetical protein